MADWHKRKVDVLIVDCQKRAKELFNKTVDEADCSYKSTLQHMAQYWYREARLLNGCEY